LQRQQEYYQNNKESILQYYQNNKESILQRQQEYYQNNKESILQRQQEYYQNNKESISLKYNENKKKPFTSNDRYSDFGKKVYPMLSCHRYIPEEDSTTPRVFYCLNSNSTPEEIQNSLMQHCNTPEGRRAVANRIERVTQRFSRINIYCDWSNTKVLVVPIALTSKVNLTCIADLALLSLC
jgi:hypothetical protein